MVGAIGGEEDDLPTVPTGVSATAVWVAGAAAVTTTLWGMGAAGRTGAVIAAITAALVVTALRLDRMSLPMR
ncbi:MAG: hypothetical protein ACKOYM_04320 [Actinomycetes bacterium]